MQSNPLKGKRYINLLRCSTAKQGDTSIPDQKLVNDIFARDVGMIHVRDVDLAGVSASKTFNRTDIEVLVDEARRLHNFDVVLVHDLSRLTRGGIRHAAYVRRQFEKAKVRVVSANDNIPEGDEGEFFEAFIHWKNKTYAKNLGEQCARGSRSSLEAGRRPHCSHTPFGFDRLYSGPDGKPRAILRQVNGQLRHLIHCETNVARELRPDSTGHFPPFQKQHDETSKLILGTQEKVEAVRLMFEWHYRHGHSLKEIKHELEKRDIKPSYADRWNPSTIRALLTNPIYLGRAVSCKVALGVHVMLSAGRPQRSLVDQSDYEDGERRTIAPVPRPRTDWLIRTEEHLLNFIEDATIRERAEIAIHAAEEKHVAPKPENYLRQKAAKRERHRRSPYILRDLLRSKDGGFSLQGCTQGSNGYARRTYIVGAYRSGVPAASHLGQYLPAPQAEEAVLSVLRSAFELGGLMQRLIREAVVGYTKEAAKKMPGEASLKSEYQTLGKKIRRLISASDIEGKSDEEDDEQIATWKRRREQVALEMSLINTDAKQIDVENIVESVSKVLLTPKDELDGESAFYLRNTVNAWCSNMEVDLKTRDITFSLGVPAPSTLVSMTRNKHLCVQSNLTQQTALYAHNQKPLVFASFRCFAPFRDRERKKQWPHKWAYLWEQLSPCRQGFSLRSTL